MDNIAVSIEFNDFSVRIYLDGSSDKYNWDDGVPTMLPGLSVVAGDVDEKL